ncbi:MAG TPA: ABC transporter permease [Thermoanaerobaculia bacterium]|nr:ABC transporter permease [Thermoanaerobaculia bacterium]
MAHALLMPAPVRQLLHDLRFGLRSLRRRPGFALAAIVTLALGIGANAAIFSLVSAALVRPLPFRDAGRIVSIGSNWTGFEHSSVSIPEYLDYRDRARSFESIAVYRETSINLTAGTGEPEHARIALTTASFFDGIGVSPAVGRSFTVEEDRPGGPGVVLLGWSLWQRRFGGDRAAVGRTISIEGEPATIVGVMPRGFRFPSESELWAPLRINPAEPGNRGAHNRGVIARLRAGVGLETARSEMSALGAALQAEHPDNYPAGSGWGVSVRSLREILVGEVRRPLLVLMGAVTLVLLLACANVASLMLGQAARRGGEMATRAALGAGPGRLARQILGESLLIGVAGGVLGCVLARGLVPLLVAISPEPIRTLDGVSVDLRVLAFAFVASIFAAMLFGLPTALRVPVAAPGREVGGARVTRSFGAREILVALEVALAFVLLIGAGLLGRTLVNLLSVEAGLDPRGVATGRISLSREAHPTSADLIRAHGRVVEILGGAAGIAAAGSVSILPLSGSDTDYGFGVENRIPATEGLEPFEQARIVAGDYFGALRIPLLRGRSFEPADGEESPPVVMVSASFASKYWPGEEAIGKRIKLWGADAEGPWRTVVGIVGDVRHFGLGREATPILYFPLAQLPQRSMTLVARSPAGVAVAAGAIREAVRELDPGQAIHALQPMEEIVRTSVASERLSLGLIAAFSTIALLLAAVGIYGVLSFLVGQRTREIGIRVAVGATPAAILGGVLARGVRFTALGLLAGTAGALALTRFLEGLLFEVEALDASTFVLVALGVLAVALVACLVPARRATRLDPARALRRD